MTTRSRGLEEGCGLTVTRLRWWHLEQVQVIERDLFGVEAWSPALFWSELAQAETRQYLAVVAEPGQVVGYAGLCGYADAAYVQTIAVRRDRQGSGIGSALLRALLGAADRQGLDTVGLEVRSDNPSAQRLYARFGFETVGRRRGYYQPSGTDAIVMVLAGLRLRLAQLVEPAAEPSSCQPDHQP